MTFGGENVNTTVNTTAYIEFFLIKLRTYMCNTETRVKHQSRPQTLGQPSGCADMLMGLYGFVCILPYDWSITVPTNLMHRIYSNMLHIHLSICYGGDGLGGDSDSDRGVPEAATRLPKSP